METEEQRIIEGARIIELNDGVETGRLKSVMITTPTHYHSYQPCKVDRHYVLQEFRSIQESGKIVLREIFGVAHDIEGARKKLYTQAKAVARELYSQYGGGGGILELIDNTPQGNGVEKSNRKQCIEWARRKGKRKGI